MRSRVVFAVIGLAAFLLGQAAYAQVGLMNLPPGKWWTTRWVIQELNLLPNQQSRIEALWKRNRMHLAEQKAELDRRQQALTAILEQESIDEAAALKAYDDVQRARRVLERNTFIMRLRIKNLMTPEQQRLLEDIALRLNQQRPLKKSGRSN